MDRGIELPSVERAESTNQQPPSDDSANQRRSSHSPVVNEKIASLKSSEKVFEVQVEKSENGLGLSLAGGRDSDICYNGS